MSEPIPMLLFYAVGALTGFFSQQELSVKDATKYAAKAADEMVRLEHERWGQP